MAIEINVYETLSPRIVEIDGTTYPDVSIQELYNAIREWEDFAIHADDDTLIDAAGKEALGGGVTVGITATLQNTQVLFTGNLTPLDDGSGRTCDATDSTGTQLYVDDADFVTAGVEVGDAVYNETTNEWATITEVVDLNTLNHLALSGQGGSGWTSGDNYQVMENISCTMSGGNLVAVDDVGSELDPIIPSPFVQVARTSSSSATIQEIDAIRYSSYQNAVWVDTTGSQTGTAFPSGTREYPVNNVADALVIADDKGFDTLSVIGDITIDGSADITGMKIVGQSQALSTVTIDTSATALNCEFNNATVTGILDGGNKFVGCIVGDVEYLSGIIEECGLTGTITLGTTVITTIIRCFQAATSTPSIDMTGISRVVSVADYSGAIHIKNSTFAGNICGLGLASGHVVLESSVTAGNFFVGGVGQVVDTATSYTVLNTDGLLNKADIADAVLDESILEHGTLDSVGSTLRKIKYNIK